MSDQSRQDDPGTGPMMPTNQFVTVATEPDEALEVAGAKQPETQKSVSLTSDALRELRSNPLAIISGLYVLFIIIVAAVPQLFHRVQPIQQACLLTDRLKPPRAGHIFGNDKLGCDIFGSVIWGARPSITIGLAVTIGSGIIAVVVGSLAGFYGSWVDVVLSRLTDILLGFPFLVGAIVLLSALANGGPWIFSGRNVWTVSTVLVIFGWAGLTRIMRGSVIAAKDMDYVNAARALGATNLRLLTRHVLPNAVTPVIVLSTIGIGGVIGAESVLTFLGVGLQAPANSWGLSISGAEQVWKQAPFALFFPCLVLSITVLSFIVLGDAVRDAFDPKLR